MINSNIIPAIVEPLVKVLLKLEKRKEFLQTQVIYIRLVKMTGQ